MPRGPNGEWRPPNPIARAVHVMKIATGEIAETFNPPRRTAGTSAASEQASKAGKARAASLTPEERKKLASKAAAARWGATT